MILLAVKQYAGMALELEKATGQLQPGTFRVARFENGELHAHVDTSVTAQRCVVLGSIAPPDEQLLVLLLAHTPIGEVGHRAVIIDDILDTGGTLGSAWERLSKTGVEEIEVMVTHGLFTGTRWKDLYHQGVKRIFRTDSVPLPAGVDGQSIVRLSITPLLAKELLAIVET